MKHRAERRLVGGALCAGLVVSLSGCVSVAEFRKLERRVMDSERVDNSSGSNRGARIADLSAEVDTLRAEVGALEGRLEIAERAAREALSDARRARQEAARASLGAATAPRSNQEDPVPITEEEPDPASGSEEVLAYREAYGAWRANDAATCIDLFRKFLQTYPASPYADDAAFWMADCHYKQKDYRSAALRFDDVVRNYPTGNKAADALYRQGESLLKLGHREAGVSAFERVIREYPDSAPAAEARRKLELLKAA